MSGRLRPPFLLAMMLLTGAAAGAQTPVLTGTPAPPAENTPAENTPAEDTPEPEDERVAVLLLAVQPAAGMTNDTTQLLDDIAAVHLGQYPGLRVTSDADVRALLELEGSKVSLGCDEASCLAEIAGAMGAQYVITGRLGQLGSKYLLTYTLFDSIKAQSVVRLNITETALDAFADSIPLKLDELVLPLELEQSASAKTPTPRNADEKPSATTPARSDKPADAEGDARTVAPLPPPDDDSGAGDWSINPWGIMGSGALSLVSLGCCSTGFTIELLRAALAPHGATDGILTVDDFWATGCATLGCLAGVGALALIPTTWVSFPEEEAPVEDGPSDAPSEPPPPGGQR